MGFLNGFLYYVDKNDNGYNFSQNILDFYIPFTTSEMELQYLKKYL